MHIGEVLSCFLVWNLVGDPGHGSLRPAMFRPMPTAPCSSDRGPILVGTWSFSLAAIESAWSTLNGASGSGDQSGAGQGSGSTLLDAIEVACQHADLDLSVDSVGLGGLPDSSGRMSLDGAIMASPIRFAGVAGLRRHVHPVSVARLVMERTEHTLLCGDDADDFADRHGFAGQELLSDDAKAAFETWAAARRDGGGDPIDQRTDQSLLGLRPQDPGLGSAAGGRLFRPNDGREGAAPAGHDTIGVLGRDASGNLAAGCSTSGLPFKVPGRVGDSPIAGHGLFVQPGVGLATATGTGELIAGICASFVAVETLRRGGTLLDAIREVMLRIDELGPRRPHHQVGVVVMDAAGNVASGAYRPGFLVATRDEGGGRVSGPDLVHRPEDDGLPESAREGLAKRDKPNPKEDP